MVSSIKLKNVQIPPHAIRGSDVKLECLYDMEGDKLYSIKWYRNGHEFYRYIPTDTPNTAIFDGNGIKVDVSIPCSIFIFISCNIFDNMVMLYRNCKYEFKKI